MKHDASVREILTRGSDLVPSLTSERAGLLAEFEALLLDRAVPRGLVSRRDADRVRERHILDCLRAAAVVAPDDRSAYDLGSGAGLPGIVVAIACPELRVRLVEARRGRVAFLELAIERLDLPNCEAVGSRLEDVREPVDLCFARALAPIEEVWRLARRLLTPGGRLVYFAGLGEEDLPPMDAGRIEVVPSTVLESAGPLVIMAR